MNWWNFTRVSLFPIILLTALLAGACARPLLSIPPVVPARSSRYSAPQLTLTIVGTNDLHGHLKALPVLGGFLRVLRASRPADSVVVLDGGDMFQGTLESNLGEGAAVVHAYNALGYNGVAVGNHEFDFGPAGPAVTAQSPEDDPRGALKARAAEARFPFLSANLVDDATGAMPTIANLHGHVLQVHAGITVGIVGVTTEDTPRTTIAANFKGLRMSSLAATIAREAAAARREGATVVVVVAHAGGSCTRGATKGEAETCDATQEIARALAAIPKGEVDAVVAGHTHKVMASIVSGVPTIESWSSGRAFGRIDLTLDAATKRVVANHIFAPTGLTLPATYEQREITRDVAVEMAIAPDIERARLRTMARVGIVLDGRVMRSYDDESALGNLFADLMRESQPGADAAITNGGGLRADLPSGDLLYGALFEAMPFDNRFAIVKLHGRELRALVTENLSSTMGILSISGVRVHAVCRGKKLEITMTRDSGQIVEDDDSLVLVTSDFLATGGDGSRFPQGSVTISDALVRDGLEASLRARGGSLSARDPKIFDASHPRIELPASRPVHCGR
jgi:2',3'-cyclic-nucleotide 2'-phosphodiesterase (5'-nucleotidase family)